MEESNIQFTITLPDSYVVSKVIDDNYMILLVEKIEKLEIENWLISAADEPMKYKIIISYSDGEIFSIEEPESHHTMEHHELNLFFSELINEMM